MHRGKRFGGQNQESGYIAAPIQDKTRYLQIAADIPEIRIAPNSRLMTSELAIPR
jgi:hypothetical protein